MTTRIWITSNAFLRHNEILTTPYAVTKDWRDVCRAPSANGVPETFIAQLDIFSSSAEGPSHTGSNGSYPWGTGHEKCNSWMLFSSNPVWGIASAMWSTWRVLASSSTLLVLRHWLPCTVQRHIWSCRRSGEWCVATFELFTFRAETPVFFIFQCLEPSLLGSTGWMFSGGYQFLGLECAASNGVEHPNS